MSDPTCDPETLTITMKTDFGEHDLTGFFDCYSFDFNLEKESKMDEKRWIKENAKSHLVECGYSPQEHFMGPYGLKVNDRAKARFLDRVAKGDANTVSDEGRAFAALAEYHEYNDLDLDRASWYPDLTQNLAEQVKRIGPVLIFDVNEFPDNVYRDESPGGMAVSLSASHASNTCIKADVVTYLKREDGSGRAYKKQRISSFECLETALSEKLGFDGVEIKSDVVETFE